MIDRDAFRSMIAAPAFDEIETPGGRFRYRIPTAGDRDRLDAFIQQAAGDYSGVRGEMLAAVLVDADGERLGTPDEMRAIPLAIAEALFEPIAAAFGLGDPDQGNDLGRSAPTCSTLRSGSA